MPDTTQDVYIDDPVVKRMMARFRLAEDAERDNRERGLKALKFRRGGKEQWDEAFWTLYQEDNRPHESYNQIPQFVHQVTNDMRMNMPQIRFIPGNDASKETAEVFEDLSRNIQTSSDAEIAYDTAADCSVTIGWGYWRYVTEYESDRTFDQIIKAKWIPNPFTIYDDPTCLEPDNSDRKWLIQVCDVPLRDFNRDYDREYGSAELQTIGDEQPEWARTSDKDGTIRIAEYWEVEEKVSKIYRLKPIAGIAVDPTIYEELPKGADKSLYQERDVIVPTVYRYKCNATEQLEERKEWPGKFIPYVKVIGERLDIDGQIVLSGLVEDLIAPQKQLNYWTNAATEMVALAPKAPYLMEIGQVSDPALKAIWDKANIKSYPYLPYKAVSINGTLVGAPQRQSNAADIGSMMALVGVAQDNLYKCSGISQSGLGLKSNESSGRAILARQREGDVSTFHYSDNMARAMRAGGRILEDLIKKIYDGARTIRGTKEDKSTREIPINQDFVEGGEIKRNDLTTGYYDIVVTTGPSFTTKRQESQEFYAQLVQSNPQLMQVAGDIIVGSSDMAGADKIAERLKKTLPPNLQDDEESPIPPQVKAQMDQAQQMVDALSQQLNAAMDELEVAKAGVQEKMAQAELDKQEMEINAIEAERKFELDKLDRAIKMRELDQKEKEIAIKDKQFQLGAVKTALDYEQSMTVDNQQTSM